MLATLELRLRDTNAAGIAADLRKGRFDEADRRLLTNKASRAQIFRAFSKTNLIFNIVVCVDRGGCLFGGLEQAEAAIGSHVPRAERITVALSNNATIVRSIRMPMNAWTLAHRIGHASQIYRRRDLLWTGIDLDVTICDIFNTISHWSRQKGYNSPEAPVPEDNITGLDLSPVLVAFSNVLLTMKSARASQITDGVDVKAEATAQYLLTGRVKLNRTRGWDVQRAVLASVWSGNDDLTNPSRLWPTLDPMLLLTPFEQAKLDALIATKEAEINVAFAKYFEAMIGRTLYF